MGRRERMALAWGLYGLLLILIALGAVLLQLDLGPFVIREAANTPGGGYYTDSGPLAWDDYVVIAGSHPRQRLRPNWSLFAVATGIVVLATAARIAATSAESTS